MILVESTKHHIGLFLNRMDTPRSIGESPPSHIDIPITVNSNEFGGYNPFSDTYHVPISHISHVWISNLWWIIPEMAVESEASNHPQLLPGLVLHTMCRCGHIYSHICLCLVDCTYFKILFKYMVYTYVYILPYSYVYLFSHMNAIAPFVCFTQYIQPCFANSFHHSRSL